MSSIPSEESVIFDLLGLSFETRRLNSGDTSEDRNRATHVERVRRNSGGRVGKSWPVAGLDEAVQPAEAEILCKPMVIGPNEPLDRFSPLYGNGFRRVRLCSEEKLIDTGDQELSQLELSPSPSADTQSHYPLIHLSSVGTVSIMMSEDLYVETARDENIRVVKTGTFSAFINGNGSASSLVHPFGRLVHTNKSVCARFISPKSKDRLAVLGVNGCLFTMDSLQEAYWVSSSAKGTSRVSLATSNFPLMTNDCTLLQFYRDSQSNSADTELCQELVDSAVYYHRKDGSLNVRLGSLLICQSADGNLLVSSGRNCISCSPDGALHVRTPAVDMQVEDSQLASIKFGPAKRVHVFCSGMVVSDGGNCCTMDNDGRIIAAST